MREQTPDRYETVERLATGGVASVYRAHDTHTGDTVALKVLRDGEPDDGWRARHLRREGEVAASLSHPSLARLLDRGDCQGRPFLVYEYLPGGSLIGAYSVGALRLPDLIRIGAEVADGLAHFHARRWVHADVKPANVLFDAGGRPRLVDFGLAGPSGRPTLENGQVIASATYASPEQVAGLPLSPPSDVYALCVMLYEGVTGTNPQRNEAPQSATFRQLFGWVDAPRALNPDVPERVEDVIMRGLQGFPEDRFADGAELASALRELAEAPLPPIPVGLPARPAWMEDVTAPRVGARS